VSLGRVIMVGPPTEYCYWQEACSSEVLQLERSKWLVKSNIQSTAWSLQAR